MRGIAAGSLLLASLALAVTPRSDAEIEANVELRLEGNAEIGARSIRVSVDHGVATLEGRVHLLSEVWKAERIAAEVRSLARTWGAELDRREVPDPEFLEPWSRLLGEAGRATCDADAEALHAVRGRLDALVDALSARGDTTARWPVHAR